MLPSAIVNGKYGIAVVTYNQKKKMIATTYDCPCRETWILDTTEWLRAYNLSWQPAGLGKLMQVEFIDPDVFLMFKLGFIETLSERCPH